MFNTRECREPEFEADRLELASKMVCVFLSFVSALRKVPMEGTFSFREPNYRILPSSFHEP